MKRFILLTIAMLLSVPHVYAASCTACDAHVAPGVNVFVDFTNEELVPVFASSILPASAADNQVSYFFLNGVRFEYIQQAANSDIVPSLDTTGVSWNGATVKGGWVIPNDNTDNEGIEMSHGLTAGVTNTILTIGTDTVDMGLTFAIPDVSDYDVMIVGVRKVAAYCAVVNQATTGASGPDCYSDFAGFNVNAGDIYSITNLNAAGLSAVDTALNWIDAEVHTLEVKVDLDGVASLYVDNTVLTSTQAGANDGFTFDEDDTVMPMVIATKNASVAADTPPIFLQYHWGIQ